MDARIGDPAQALQDGITVFDAGADACTLFADAANPTSNGIYERIGFRAVAETVEAAFV